MASLELRVTVFVYIDDWLKPYQDLLPRTDSTGQQSAQKASYSELQGRTLRVTIAVVGEILAQPKVGFAGYESNRYWIVNQLFSELFPRLPHYSRYHRILRNAERLLAELALSILGDSRIHLIDSKPLPVADPKSPCPQRGTPVLGKRSSWSKFPEARKGFSTIGMVFGFKLHALTNLEGLFERWAFATANHPDVRLARELTEGLEDPESPYPQVQRTCLWGTPALELVLGDKAYIGSDVLTPKRANMKGDEVWTESLDRARTRRVRTPRGGPRP